MMRLEGRRFWGCCFDEWGLYIVYIDVLTWAGRMYDYMVILFVVNEINVPLVPHLWTGSLDVSHYGN